MVSTKAMQIAIFTSQLYPRKFHLGWILKCISPYTGFSYDCLTRSYNNSMSRRIQNITIFSKSLSSLGKSLVTLTFTVFLCVMRIIYGFHLFLLPIQIVCVYVGECVCFIEKYPTLGINLLLNNMWWCRSKGELFGLESVWSWPCKWWGLA